ncbi:MAG: NUDIX hydrolase [Pseudomonadota bacterium]|nr:NUDIX hydrolase [Pseudomonadota bacterium]
MTSDMPRIVARRPIFKGWNTLEIVTVEAADLKGRVRRHEREVIEHGEASVVLAIDRERQLAILVRQWRAPLIAPNADPYLLEACAGIIDPGETPEQTARREAEEEIGLKIGKLRKIGSVVPSAGTLTERMHLFIAEVSAADKTEDGGGNPHEGEDIEVVEVALPELFGMARRGEIEDAKTLILVQRLLLEETEAGRRY